MTPEFKTNITVDIDRSTGDIHIHCEEFDINVPANRVKGLCDVLNTVVEYLHIEGKLVDSFGMKL